MEQLQQLFKLIEVLNVKNTSENQKNKIDDYFIGKKVIIRTYYAGVHFGELIEKEDKEVILKNSSKIS